MPRHSSNVFAFESLPRIEPRLSEQEMSALKQACAPVGYLNFPPPEIIRTLRQHGYVTIVLGGIQITQQGLERLLRDRKQRLDSNLG